MESDKLEQAYHIGYFDAIDFVSWKILKEYLGHFPDVNVDVVLKKLRDELIETMK